MDIETRAWMCWCPPRDECDYRVFFTQDDADVFDDECRCSDDDADHRTQGVIQLVERSALAQRDAEVARLTAHADRLSEAIHWAVGLRGDFPPRAEGQGAYWWRTELMRRAALAEAPRHE